MMQVSQMMVPTIPTMPSPGFPFSLTLETQGTGEMVMPMKTDQLTML